MNDWNAGRIKKRAESGDYRVCTALDFAPVFERALGIRPKEKDLGKNVDFLNLLMSLGLELKPGEKFSGSSKKSPFCPTKHK